MAFSTSSLLSFPLAKPLTVPSLRPSYLRSPTPSRCPSLLRPLAAAAGKFDPPVTAVVNPAIHYANVLFSSPGYNVQVVVDENESDEALLRRFRREVSKVGIIQECKRRRFFENKQEEKKRKAREAGRRNRRRRFGPRFSSSSPTDNDAAPKEKRDDIDDNWDLPEGDLPY